MPWKRIKSIFPWFLALSLLIALAAAIYFLRSSKSGAPSSSESVARSNELADELTSHIERQWRRDYVVYQETLSIDGKSSNNLATLAAKIHDDFTEWIQPPEHISRITDPERELIGEFPGYDLYGIRFKNANNLTVEGIISIPTSGRPSYPALIIPNGTSASAEEVFGLTRTDYHRGVGKEFARDHVVFAVNIPPTTDDFRLAVTSNDHSFFLANSAGINWTYLRQVDKVRSALDYLEQEPLSNGRFSIYGISLGGETAVAASFFDRRISATAVSGTNVLTPRATQLLENRRFVYPHYYQYDIIHRPENFQLLYTMFPKPVIIELNRQDTTGVFEEALLAAQQLRTYYLARGSNDVHIVVFDGKETSNGHYMEIGGVAQILRSLR